MGRRRPDGSEVELLDAPWMAVAPLSGAVFAPQHVATTASLRQRRPDPHAVRLMNEYTVDWPLWTVPSGAASEIKELLDERLSARLRQWAQIFNAHYDHVDGWDDPDLAAEHRAEAGRLLAALRAALPSPWTVSLEYWETNEAAR